MKKKLTVDEILEIAMKILEDDFYRHLAFVDKHYKKILKEKVTTFMLGVFWAAKNKIIDYESL